MSSKEHRQVSPQQHAPTGARVAPPFNPLRVLMKRRWQFFACMLVVSSVALVSTHLSKTRYHAKARVQVSMDNLPSTAGAMGMEKFAMMGSLTDQVEMLNSRKVLAEAVKHLNNAHDDRFSTEGNLQELRSQLRVKPVSGSTFIDIIGISEQPSEAASIANHVAAAFVQTAMENSQAETRLRIARIEGQITDYDHQIAEQNTKLEKFRQDHLMTGGATALAVAENRINATEQRVTNVRLQRLELANDRLQLERSLAAPESLIQNQALLAKVDSESMINSLKGNLERLRQQYGELSQVYLPGHQRLKNVTEQMRDLESRLRQQRRLRLEGLYQEAVENHDRLAKEEESLARLLKQYKQAGVEITEKQLEYEQMAGTLLELKKFRQQCVAWRREIQLNQGINDAPVTIVDAAQVPKIAAGLTKHQQAAAILLAGLVLSLLFVFASDHMATASPPAGSSPQMIMVPVGNAVGQAPGQAISYWPNVPASSPPAPEAPASPVMAPASASAPLLGRLRTMVLGEGNDDNRAFAARCQIVLSDQSSPEAETFREIGTRLLHRFGGSRQSVVFTGAADRSGKTTAAVNLAVMLAQANRRVVLVDADVVRPGLQRVFAQTEEKPGLKTLLSDPSVLEEALCETEIENLNVVHFGQAAMPGDGFDPDVLAELDHELKKRFDWVVYDTASLDHVFTQNLLQAVGKALFVTSPAQSVPHEVIVEQIELCGAANIGCVENLHVVRGASSKAVEQPVATV